MIRTITALTVIASLTACSMAPPYVRPTAPVPQSWPIGDAYLRQSEATLPAVTYRDIFRDPRLQTLIGQALVNNRDLMVAAANIAAARAQYRIQRAQHRQAQHRQAQHRQAQHRQVHVAETRIGQARLGE